MSTAGPYALVGPGQSRQTRVMPTTARALIDEMFQQVPVGDDLHLDPAIDPQDAALLGHGFYMRVRGLARAALLLHDNDFASEAAPVRRSMYEHAISIRWIVASPANAYESFRLKHREQFRKAEPGFTPEWRLDDETRKTVLATEVASNAENRLLQITGMIAEYADPNFSPVYYLESEFSHPTIVTAKAHTVTSRVGDPDEVVAIYLAVATAAYDRLLAGQPLGDFVERVRNELNALVVANRPTGQ